VKKTNCWSCGQLACNTCINPTGEVMEGHPVMICRNCKERESNDFERGRAFFRQKDKLIDRT